MARAPRPGAGKTRLRPRLGADGCARLQAALLERTLRLACRFAPGDVHLALDGSYPTAVPARRLVQRGADLGERMRHAVGEVTGSRPRPVLVIGTDAPTLSERQLSAAAAALCDDDVVLGPALDGGYYLAGVRGPSAADAVFAIESGLWGGPDVLAASRKAAVRAGLRVSLLEPLRDLDTPADVDALLADDCLPPELTALLQPVAARA
ncbi:MAG: glycosyltransferase [Jatrophihabitans sp.]|nr:MAG: glycosyltransferase [Jatrophihabitans sp.]